ncbi:hypothetical protein OUZ56_028545 [Daphnia magna]|uniref:Uncharacterized protein n=1 Tax=Daphnia magna TaxID=35525 RepID=A0ABR0B494_9CRUS|nr:hypothetical protein OUZ56_028545 [Daphnia magna]
MYAATRARFIVTGGTEATHNGRCGFNFAWMDGWMEKLAERLFFCRRRNKAKAIIIDLLPSSTGRRNQAAI